MPNRDNGGVILCQTVTMGASSNSSETCGIRAWTRTNVPDIETYTEKNCFFVMQAEHSSWKTK